MQKCVNFIIFCIDVYAQEILTFTILERFGGWEIEYPLIKDQGRDTHGIIAKTLYCALAVSKVEFQSFYYVQFWTNTLAKGMNPLTSARG